MTNLPSMTTTYSDHLSNKHFLDSGQEIAARPRTRASFIFAWIPIVILAFLSVSWICFDFVHFPVLPNRSFRDCSCGWTIEAAKEKNCSYDELAAAWLPQSCIDQSLSREFARSGPLPGGLWQYYDGPNSNASLLSVQEVADRANTGDLVWVTKEWHIAHCLFYWRKFERSHVTGVRLEKRYTGKRHAEHCTMALLNRNFTLDMVETRFGVQTNT